MSHLFITKNRLDPLSSVFFQCTAKILPGSEWVRCSWIISSMQAASGRLKTCSTPPIPTTSGKTLVFQSCACPQSPLTVVVRHCLVNNSCISFSRRRMASCLNRARPSAPCILTSPEPVSWAIVHINSLCNYCIASEPIVFVVYVANCCVGLAWIPHHLFLVEQ